MRGHRDPQGPEEGVGNQDMRQPFGKTVPFTEKLKKLRAVVGTRDTVAIVVHADPDALASAMALKRLFWRRVRPPMAVLVGSRLRLGRRAFAGEGILGIRGLGPGRFRGGPGLRGRRCGSPSRARGSRPGPTSW